MKSTSPPQKSRAGFTLIELLVVIVIIAVLAGVAFPVFNAVQENARKQQARSQAVNLANAIRLYHSEYSRYPLQPDMQGQDNDSNPIRTDSELMNVLMGIEDEALNPRERVFFEGKDAGKKQTNGIIFEGGGESGGRLVDNYGEEFYVIIDGDYDGKVQNPNSDENTQTLRVPVLIYSSGEDKDPSTWDDNIISW